MSWLSFSRSTLLRIVIYFHIFAVFTWSLPTPPPELRIGVIKHTPAQFAKNWSAHFLYWNETTFKTFPVKDYLRVIGAEQNWNMFAPNPITSDMYVDAVVTLADGEKVPVLFPRGSQMSQSERFFKERYRKFIETVHQESAAILWPMLANYIARRAALDPTNPPVFVELYRHTRVVTSPGQVPNREYDRFKFFETPIKPEVVV